jgi:two-component system chemotaxis sensor kinase CheA
MEKLRQIFTLECQESLQQMEDALLQLETNPQDTEAIHLLFRSTHTIKGSADLVEFTHIAEFAHVMESVLDEVRSGKIKISAAFINMLLACRDHINLLSECVENHVDPALQQTEHQLLEQLNQYLGHSPPAKKNTLALSPIVHIDPPPEVPTNHWHISLRFSEDAFVKGVEPTALFNYLTHFGEISDINTLLDGIPSAADMVAENCYLGFELEFISQATQKQIVDLFTVVHEHCQINVYPSEPLEESPSTPQHEKPAEVAHALPEETPAPKSKVTFDRQQASKKKSLIHQTLYVDAEKLDHLINLVGELVIATASVNLQVAAYVDEDLKEATSTMSRLVEDIRDHTLSMRMVRIHDTFNRFPRMVHDHCRELDKRINLIINGADTELDKSMVEKISEPLMHLVRNAIDHGIEPPTERLVQGKTAVGTVRLNAYHNSGNIIIEVNDDGRGLDEEKILTTAFKRGLVKAAKTLSESEINRLIFEPGFSTSEHITQLSGRGVGLDSVKRSIHAQNGWVNVKSKLGQGTTVQISLPLTLAIIDGFLLGVGSSIYVIPLDHVIECVEFAEDTQPQRGCFNLRGHLLPLIHLGKLFNTENGEVVPRREHVVVVNYGGSEDCRAGLVVNALLGEFQAVIKPLGKIFEKLAGISGATILGSGEVALILDVPALVQRYGIFAGIEEGLHCQQGESL